MDGHLPAYVWSGEFHPNYAGGREVLCEVCLAPAGWRKPSKLRSNKTGFRCKAHRYARFKRPKQQTDSDQDREERDRLFQTILEESARGGEHLAAADHIVGERAVD